MSGPPDPPDLQVCREQEHNYEEQRTAFLHPLTIRSIDVGSEILDIRLQRNRQTLESLFQLNPDGARHFAYKTTAIYVSSSFNISSAFTLFSQIYDVWFPRRARDRQPNSLWYGNFFANLAKLDFSDNPNTKEWTFLLHELSAFHSRLASQLAEMLPQTLTPELSALDRRFGAERVGGMYQLRQSWGKVFVWIDRGDWSGEGVRVIARDRHMAARLGLERETQEVMVERPGRKEGLGWSDMRVYRMNLEKAIKVIAALDEGGRREREWNYMTQKWYDGCLED